MRTREGTDHLVSGHPSSEMSICGLRRAVVASLSPQRPGLAQWIETVAIGGSLEQAFAGVYQTPTNHRGEWWFATLLRHQAVEELLTNIDGRFGTDDRIECVIKPDPCLGVTVVGLAARHESCRDLVSDVVTAAYESAVVEELVRGATLATKS
ncbi:MAG: hypothetical protein AAGD35_04385 [Actinomycetota bacterium]